MKPLPAVCVAVLLLFGVFGRAEGCGCVTLNFDDATDDHWAVARSMVNAAGLKATFYVVTGFLDTSAHLTRGQVIQLWREGHEIGVHSRTHRDLSLIAPHEWIDEMIGSMSDVYWLLHPYGYEWPRDPFTFAYPFGVYNDDLVSLAKWAFVASRSTDAGSNTAQTNRSTLRRRGVESTTSFSQIRSWIDGAVASHEWLILVFHLLDHSGRQYSTTPEMLQQVVSYLIVNRIPVVTTKQGAQL
jgi:peptidoglycan/xylan/chitin deacetylase (PgdA/CDA1 family)